jgi:sugar phosphate isomerase/epimerase
MPKAVYIIGIDDIRTAASGGGNFMKLGVVSSALVQLDLSDALDRVKDMGLSAIEIACAGWQPNLRHGDPKVLAHDADARGRWHEEFVSRGLEISALSIHGQPLSPDPQVANDYREQFRDACLLAELIGVSRLTLLGGLPEGSEGDSAPLWVVNAFPFDQSDVLEWQWEQRVIPYWQEQGKLAEDHGCRLCFEMHPMDVLYNPRSLLRLREAIGPTVGANFDPSHLWWQGIDPLEALRVLGDCIYHVHAKDTQVNEYIVRVNGVLDATPFGRLAERSWSFRTVGYAHGELFWRQFISALREIGYDDVLSIEHEDEYMNLLEGLEKGAQFLAPLILTEPRDVAWYELTNAGVDAS